MWLTILMTLLHLDEFHLGEGPGTAQFGAWLWTIAYIVDPPFLTMAYILQTRLPGVDAPRDRELPRWFQVLLFVQGAVALFAAVTLFISPEDLGASIWPWAITPIGARAMAAWLAALAVVLLSAAVENDWRRIRAAVVSYLVLGVMLGVALLRFTDDFEGGFAGSVYLVVVGTMLLTGAYGTFEAYKSQRVTAPMDLQTPAT